VTVIFAFETDCDFDFFSENVLSDSLSKIIMMIHLLDLTPAGYLTAPDNGA
jgi:hypothetical protein